MDLAELRAALTVTGGEVRVGTLTPAVLGAPVVIEAAVADTGVQDAVVVRGRSTFFAARDVPVELRATADGVSLRYDMPATWRFSHSFPALPKVVDWTRTTADPVISPLDALPFTGVTFQVDSAVTFEARLRPGGLDVLEHLLSGAEPMVVRGTVVPEGAPAPALDAYPWTAEQPAPGIHLRAPLAATPAVGQLGFDELVFRLYSPLTQDWLAAHRTYEPVFGYAMRMAIPSAVRRQVAVFAALELGASELVLFGAFRGFTLGSLAELADLFGTGELRAGLPEDLGPPEVLKRLELTGAAISLTRNDTGVCVGWVSVTVGIPELNWRVWEEHFQVTSVACRFELADPFGQASRAWPADGGVLNRLSVTLTGTMRVEDVPVRVVASNADGFGVHVELTERRTFPLRGLMNRYLPGVPAPGDLTVDALRVSVAPGRSYGMAMALAGGSSPWLVPLGPVELTVRDVFFTFTCPHGGKPSGAFRGTIALGRASLTTEYSVPGPLVLRASAERVGLTELARELAGVADLTQPPGFPELALTDPEVVFTAHDGRYDVRVATTVAIGDAANLKFAAAVLHAPEGSGFAAGIWTGKWPHGNGWSPGTLWAPLRALTIESVGLFLCSIAPSATRLATLVPAADVPSALRREFALKAGVNFLARLRLDTGAVAVLRELFDGDVVLDLFARYERGGKTALVARAEFEQRRNAFLFDGFELTWASTGMAGVEIAVRAFGTLAIADEKLRYDVSGRLTVEGTVALALAVADWVHPFGYERLTVNRVAIGIALSSAGVTIAFDGTFQFTTATGKVFTFAVAGSITDFEAPTALAFLLRSDSPDTTLKFSEVIEGITTIDVTSLDTPAGYLPLATWVRVLDLFLAVEQLCFWVVTVDRSTIGGKDYLRGFGFRGRITLFGKPVVLEVEVHQAESRFAGRAELPEPVSFADALTLRRQGDPAKGPLLAVSSTVDAEHREYLSVSADLALLDVFRASCHAKASDSGLTFSLDLASGTAGTGTWAAQHVEVLVSRERLAFEAGFSCDFGLHNVALGGFDLFGLVRVPTITLPEFRFHARFDLKMSPARFLLDAAVSFTFLGQKVHGRVSVDLDIKDAPATLTAIGATLLTAIRDNLAALLSSALDTPEKLANWAKDNLATLGGGVIQQVTRVFRQELDLGSAIALAILSAAGLPSGLLGAAMAAEYHWPDVVLAAAAEAFDDFVTHVGDFFGSRDVAMVVFNLTDHRLEVTGAHGDEITAHTGRLIGPGAAGVAGVFAAGTGRWEWVYLRDLDTGVDYQLYIQMARVFGNRYFSFDYYNPHHPEENEGSRALPPDVATSAWNGGPAAAYTLRRVP